MNIEEAVAIDDATVEFRLKKPKATMLRLWIPIVPEHIWSKIPGDKAATFNSEPPVIGSGPFQTIEVKKGSYIRFAANKNYWKGAPKVDEVILEVYTNQDTMAMDLKSGAIDVAVQLPAAQFDALKNEPGITTKAALFRYFVELAMNVYDSDDSQANPVLRDLEFRQAISWAVDKQKIVDTALSGYGEVGQSIIGPFTNYAWTPTPEETFGYDMAKAAQLLDEAGYTNSDGDGIREDKQGKPIELRLWTRSESPEQQRAGKLIAVSFEELGLKIVLSVENDGTINDGIYAYKGYTYAPNYDLFIWGWGRTANPGYQLGSFISSQIEWWNDACWCQAAAAGASSPSDVTAGRHMELLYLSRADVEGLGVTMREVLRGRGRRVRGQGPRADRDAAQARHPHAPRLLHPRDARLRAGARGGGLKWVSGYPPNPAKGLPYITGLLSSTIRRRACRWR